MRKEAGKEPLNNDEVKGQLKEKMSLMLASKDEVLQSVINVNSEVRQRGHPHKNEYSRNQPSESDQRSR